MNDVGDFQSNFCSGNLLTCNNLKFVANVFTVYASVVYSSQLCLFIAHAQYVKIVEWIQLILEWTILGQQYRAYCVASLRYVVC